MLKAKIFDAATSIVVLVLTRYLLELATPQEDWATVKSFIASISYLKFYAPHEFHHQIVGMRLLRDALTYD